MVSTMHWARRLKRARLQAQQTLFHGAGMAIPRSLRLALARQNPRLAHLMGRDGNFQIRDYLGQFVVNIDVRSNTEREMLAGRAETGMLEAFEKWARGTCLDVGANVGSLTLALAKRVGPKGSVVAVEPGPTFAKRLKGNLNLNPAIQDRVEVRNIGLSEKPDTLNWTEDPWFPGNAWLLGKGGVPVEVTTLDRLWQGRGKLDFVKVDVEGMENQVLLGGLDTIRAHQPVLVLETSLHFEDILGRPIRKELQDTLHRLEYRLWDLGGNQRVNYPHLPHNSLALPKGVQP